jgi:glycosyltransferase involved in cell wall biosynthesis
MVDAALTGLRGAPRLRRPVLMIAHSYYEEDPRVRREAESLIAAGRPVHVIALRRDGEPATAEVAGVAVTRLDVQRHQGAGLLTYLREYLSFGARAALAAMRAHRRERFSLVQVHSLPDFLAFAALPLRVVGVPLVLDLHEAMPEFFRSRFPRASHPLFHRLLLWQERLSIGFSTATVSVNDAMRGRLLGLGVAPHKVTVVANSPSLARFDRSSVPMRPFASDGVIRMVYAGALTPTYELDVAICAMARLLDERPDLDLRFEVYGRGDSEPILRTLAADLGVADRVAFHGRIPIESVPAAIAAADIGLAPTRRDPFTDLSLSTKIYEYAAMGKPVVATRLPMVERTFPPGTVATYDPGDAEAMARAITTFVDDAAVRTAAVEWTMRVVRESSWERESRTYVALIDRLADSDRREAPARA